MAKRGKKSKSNGQISDGREVLETGNDVLEKKSRQKKVAVAEVQEPDNDEKDIMDKISAKEKESENDDVIQEVVQDSDGNANDFSKTSWWLAIPRRDRFAPGDIVYHVDMDRFGIFVQPSRKEGLVKMRLFKLGSKTEVYTRDWYFPFEVLTLVKHSNTVKRGFAETEKEFVRRAGKSLKRELEVV